MKQRVCKKKRKVKSEEVWKRESWWKSRLAGAVLLHQTRHQGSKVRACERTEERGEVKKRGQKLKRIEKKRGTSLWGNQIYLSWNEMRERLTRRGIKWKAEFRLLSAHFLANLCETLLMQQHRLWEMETERRPWIRQSCKWETSDGFMWGESGAWIFVWLLDSSDSKTVERSEGVERKAKWRKGLENAAHFSGKITCGWIRSCQIVSSRDEDQRVITKTVVNWQY